jgi:hypothetical protein
MPPDGALGNRIAEQAGCHLLKACSLNGGEILQSQEHIGGQGQGDGAMVIHDRSSEWSEQDKIIAMRFTAA